MKLTTVAPLAAFTLLVTIGASGAEKRAFAIADHYRVVGIGDPQPSRDGSRIAYVASYTDLANAKRWSELRIVNADGSGDRALTQGRHLDASPRWSPDGTAIAFTSDRAGEETQLFLLRLDGGDPRQLTTFPMGVGDPVWSPDGRFIALAADLYPECGADAACNEKIAKAWEGGPLKAHMADALLYRHWTSWRDGKRSHVLLLDVAGGALTDLTPGDFDSPPFSLGGETGYAFAPDGRELAFVSNHDPVPARSTNSDVFTVALDEHGKPGAVADITAENKAWDGTPVYSPDGRYIAYRTQKVPGYESDLFRIALYDRAAKRSKVLTEAFRDWVTAVEWRPDGRSIVFQAEQEGATPLYELDLASGKWRKLFADGALGAWELTPGGVAYVRRSVGEPAEIYRARLDGSGREKVTHANDALLAEVDVRPAETVWVNAPGGRRVEVFIVKPHGFDPAKKYPLILNVHGGPQQEWVDSYRGDWQVYPGAGYVVAFPNPTGSNGYGQAFVDGIGRDWGGKVYEDVMAVADAVAKLPYVDATRMGAMGWSYGGYFMMWLEGHSDRFKAIASMMGVYDLRSMHSATEELWFPEHDLGGEPWDSPDYQKWSPSGFVTSFKTPCLVITGERDYRVPYTQSLQFFTDLQEMHVPSRLVVFSKAGHWPSWYEMAFYYDVHLDWFHRWLGGGPAPWDPEKFLRNEVFEAGK
ncbi:MAG TPA: S9 family peptidase [Thermoanaerobaculaceae bacterium]|nr:S9 family peptidase [Thermoanaerobaculaceae bacterium]